MASTTSLFTGLSGLAASSRRLEVIGNNIANVNTTAFKSNRMTFAPTFSRNLSLGTAPTTNSGGTNPGQVGLGVTIAGTQRNFTNGAISTTGINTDLALEGDGFFVVRRGQEQLYTRAGSFQFNSTNELVTQTGERVRGFAVDDNFNIVTGQLVDVSIPQGTLTIAEATRNVRFAGNLNAEGELATSGSALTFDALAGLTLGDLLTALPGTTDDFTVGDVITVTGAERGGKELPDASLTVSAGTTVFGFLSFLQDALGVVPNGGFSSVDPLPGPEPGMFSVDASGVITFTGNWGESNDLGIADANVRVTDSAGVDQANPLTFAKTAQATGESVRNTFIVYDSLGSELSVDLTLVLAGRDSTGTYWRAFLHSADDTDLALHLENGSRTGTFGSDVPLLRFDNFGRLASAPEIAVELDRLSQGSVDPLIFNLSFESSGESVTALADGASGSQIAATFQDGSPIGVLNSFSVGENGVITGGFSNGLTRTVGQIALANFTNPEGLVDAGNNLFMVGPNSGTPLVTEPQAFGTGRIIGGALELSNVDLSQEFISMILTSTGYSASARLITTTDQLIQQLLQLGR